MFDSVDPNSDADVLGFSKTLKCPYCDAAMYIGENGDKRPICLNACAVPYGEVKRAQQLMHDYRYENTELSND